MRRTIYILALLAALPLLAQQTYTFAGNAFLLPEFMAMIGEENESVTVNMTLPAERRLDAYKDLDLKKDDKILFFNKKRIRSVDSLKEKYETLAIGDTVMLGIKRGEGDMFILRFPKMDPEKSGMQMRVVTGPEGEGPPPIVLAAEGLVLREAEGRVKVMATLQDAESVLGVKLQEGDCLYSINGEEIANAETLNGLYDKIKIGEPVTMVFERGDETLKAEFKKPAPKTGMRMIRR